MLPYTVNSPRSYKGKSGKERRSSSVWCIGLLVCLFAAAGGVWYLKAHSAYVRNLVAVITEHEAKYSHLALENEKLDGEIRRMNRALEAAKADREKVQGDISFRNTRIEEAETSWRAAAAQLEALTKTHDGVSGQLKEAHDRTSLAEQETIEAAMKVAECRRELAAAAQGGREPVLASQAQTDSELGASSSMTDRLLNSSLSAGVSAVVNTTVSTIAEASQIDPLVQLGKTADDDDETHPGLERPFSKQQELRL
ncbi:hypothetical protein WJX82_009414 [Trebouxia sp. C0006]